MIGKTMKQTSPKIEQGSFEWFLLRLGKLTASKLALALGKTKGGWVASRDNVMCEMAVERLTGTPTESFTSTAMQWGKDTEPLARAAYSFRRGVEVEEVAFVDHPELDWSGASPDGLVGKDGLIEIKCPNTANHIKTITGGAIKKAYIWQMQWQMACTGRKWCDFVSFDPRMPEHLQMLIRRVEFDEALVASLEHDAKEFLGEVDRMVKTLENMEIESDG
jgi:putative phage-type endonuclease